jgi:hypothetical protein
MLPIESLEDRNEPIAPFEPSDREEVSDGPR